jgi:hypothetical protein
VSLRSTVWLLGVPNFSPDFTHRYLSAPESDGDAALNSAPTLLATFDSWTPTPLLREWAKATLVSGEWKDVLVVTASVSIPFFSGTPHELDTLMVCSLHVPESQSIGSYVNVWKQLTV